MTFDTVCCWFGCKNFSKNLIKQGHNGNTSRLKYSNIFILFLFTVIVTHKLITGDYQRAPTCCFPLLGSQSKLWKPLAYNTVLQATKVGCNVQILSAHHSGCYKHSEIDVHTEHLVILSQLLVTSLQQS